MREMTDLFELIIFFVFIFKIMLYFVFFISFYFVCVDIVYISKKKFINGKNSLNINMINFYNKKIMR